MEYVWAFLVGGALCAIGQALIDYTKLTPARILTGYVVSGTCWRRASARRWMNTAFWEYSWEG